MMMETKNGMKTEEIDFVQRYGERRAVECGYCKREISKMVRMHCAECPNLVMCLQCFSVGAAIHPHKNSHDYHITDNIKFPLFCEGWTAQEELLLLDGIEMFGMGSWHDIAEHVGTKNDKECQAHYLDDYLGRYGDCLPLQTLVDGKFERTADLVKPTGSNQVRVTMPGKRLDDPVGRDPKVDGGGKSVAEILGEIGKMPGGELAGFMPLRGDFDVEHANEAEHPLADMEFKAEDTVEEKNLKLDVVKIYNNKLQEREERKAFVRERGLLDYKKTAAADRRRPREERELIARMRVFARFHSAEEHTAFVEGLLKAMKLRKRIEKLQHYRRLGIRTFAEADLYEERRKSEMNSSRNSANASSSMPPYLSSGSRGGSSARDRTSRYLQRQRHGTSTPVGTGLESINFSGGRADFFHAEGADLLSQKELELCSTLKLLPKYYLMIKDVLLTAAYKEGFLKKSSARALVKIDMKKTNDIYDFFVQCGWISEAPGELNETATIH